jgi:hypothetical protein
VIDTLFMLNRFLSAKVVSEAVVFLRLWQCVHKRKGMDVK